MAKTVDLTKVNLAPKSLVYLTIGVTMVLVIYSVAQFGAGKVKDILKGATSAAAESAEEF